jgi:hypothetical protein
MATKLSEDIDSLLEQYLQLLDQYADLRSQLSVAQSSVPLSPTYLRNTASKLTPNQIHQHIARANFSAERGIRYGEELYDARMRASRLCRITVPTHDEGPPEHGTTASTTAFFTLSTFAPHEEVEQTSDGAQQEKLESAGVEDLELDGLDLGERTPVEDAGRDTNNVKATDDTTKDSEKVNTGATNPLRMFGILTPPSLRLAQATSLKTVSTLIPAIINLDVQMKEVEIQIRRARKHKSKAERQQTKDTEGTNLKSSEVRKITNSFTFVRKCMPKNSQFTQL